MAKNPKADSCTVNDIPQARHEKQPNWPEQPTVLYHRPGFCWRKFVRRALLLALRKRCLLAQAQLILPRNATTLPALKVQWGRHNAHHTLRGRVCWNQRFGHSKKIIRPTEVDSLTYAPFPHPADCQGWCVCGTQENVHGYIPWGLVTPIFPGRVFRAV